MTRSQSFFFKSAKNQLLGSFLGETKIRLKRNGKSRKISPIRALSEADELPLCFFIRRPQAGGPLATSLLLEGPQTVNSLKNHRASCVRQQTFLFCDMPTHLYQEKIKKKCRQLKNSKIFSGFNELLKGTPRQQVGRQCYGHPPYQLRK